MKKESTKKDEHRFVVENDSLKKVDDGGKTLVANFHLEIKKQILVEDEGKIRDRQLQIDLKMPNRKVPFAISANEFLSQGLKKKIFEVAGSSAIIYGSTNDLQVGTQDLAGKIPEITIKSHGLTYEGNFYSQGMLITPSGIMRSKDILVDLSGGNLSRYLEFIYPDPKRLPHIGRHLVGDFLHLKNHRVMFVLAGHIGLAPFASEIPRSFSMEKVALHLMGASGGGKTFLVALAMGFFGQFNERLASWNWTPNSLESEGYWFRDALFVIDDFKGGFVPQQSLVRIFQDYSGGHGRSRLSSSSRIQRPVHIRGLLLSTGEDFLADVASVTGRTICIPVEPEKNTKAGEQCKKFCGLYSMFTPALIHAVISQRDWKTRAKEFVDEKISLFHKEVMDLSNGLRVASNWGLNALGFEFFLQGLSKLGVISTSERRKMADEYLSIALDYLQEQRSTLRGQSPCEIFFRILSQKLEAGSISVKGLKDSQSSGKVIGMVKDQAVLIFPDIVFEVLSGHFHAVNQQVPLSRNSLRDALAQNGLLQRPKAGRWSTQFRDDAGRQHNGWAFDKEMFQKKIKF